MILNLHHMCLTETFTFGGFKKSISILTIHSSECLAFTEVLLLSLYL